MRYKKHNLGTSGRSCARLKLLCEYQMYNTHKLGDMWNSMKERYSKFFSPSNQTSKQCALLIPKQTGNCNWCNTSTGWLSTSSLGLPGSLHLQRLPHRQVKPQPATLSPPGLDAHHWNSTTSGRRHWILSWTLPRTQTFSASFNLLPLQFLSFPFYLHLDSDVLPGSLVRTVMKGNILCKIVFH